MSLIEKWEKISMECNECDCVVFAVEVDLRKAIDELAITHPDVYGDNDESCIMVREIEQKIFGSPKPSGSEKDGGGGSDWRCSFPSVHARPSEKPEDKEVKLCRT